MNEMVQSESERPRTTRLGAVVRHLSAALVAMLLIPVTGAALLQIQVLSASAAVTNGSMEISSGGQQQINLGTGFNPNTGATFEAWVNFSTIASSNRIFRAWTGTTATRAFELTWSNTGLMSWYSAVSQTTCTIQTKAPVVGTWYNLALAVENYSQAWTANTSSVFLNGNLLRICRDARNPSTGNIQGVQLGGSAGQAMKMSAVRISSTTRYSTQSYSHTQTTTYPTTTDSTVWALYNAVYDDSDANSCFTNSDPGAKSATLTTVTGSVSCSSSSPASRTTAVDGSISLPSGATAALGRFGGANTSRFDGSNRHMPDEGWTWEGWVKFSTIAAGWNTIFVACSNGPAGSTIIEGGCSGFGNPIQLLWNSTNGQASYTGCSNVSTGVVPVTNEWYHLAVSTAATGGTVNNYLFINGERKGTCTANSGAYNGGVEGFRIGGTTGTTMKIGPTRYRGLQRYISNFTPARTYGTDGTFFVLNTKYDNYDLCLRNEDPANRMSPYGTMSGGTATCSTDIPPPLPPAFSYSTSPVSVSSGSAFTAMTPTQAGSQIDSYSISPALSNGLTLNPTTGVISGTPIYSPVTSYVVTGTQNSSGLQATANVSITVNKLASSVSIALANSVAQVGVTNTITATASQPGNVSFQTDLGVIPGCSSVATTTVSPFRATCDWDPVSIYYTMNATLTPTSNEYAVSTSSPSLTNLRGSLSLTSTGPHVYPGESQNLASNNSLLFSFPSDGGLNPSRSFTIETWVKTASSTLNMKLAASYGNSFYADRGEGFFVDTSGTRLVPFVGTGFAGYRSISAVSGNAWHNVVFQRTIVPGQSSRSFDSIFVDGQLVQQYGNDCCGATRAGFVKIGPFTGVTQIGPTQVLGNSAPYPSAGFSPSTTYSYGANTLALFQPSPTACGSAAMAPSTVAVSYQTATFSCTADFPVALPRVESVVANSGPQAGGNAVTISGKNFVNLTGVKFGSTTVAGTNYTVNSFGTEINVTNVPPGTNTVDVTVITAAGTSSITAGSSYTYLPAPTISGLDRTTGSTLGGNAVVITGTNFTSASAVTFGSTNASYFNVNSETQITAVSPPGVSGVVDIRVTTPGGTSAIVFADRFTYTSAVSIIGISPSTGSTLGGTAVVISGTNFTDASAVVFGSTNATSFTVDSASSITAVAPAGTAGVVDIRVTAPGGTSSIVAASQFTYTSSVIVTGITPSTGSAAGGASVVISGTNFTGATAVVFGSTNATSFTVDRSSQITAVAPAGTAGLVNVRVTAPGGTSAIVPAGQFTYFPVPTISSLGTTVGLTTGGTSVVITGTNFTNVNSVTFGSSSASNFTVNSATQITAVSPSGTAGVVDVRVTTLGGTTAIVSAGQFTYFGLPTIDAVGPSSGPTAGSTSVVITGTNFTGATAVTFGTTNATSFTVDSPTQITAVSPARPAGTVDIKVANPGGTSAVSLYGIYGQFSYLSPPSISSISPSTGSITGGASVTITGTDLSNLLSNGGVMFGSLHAQSVVQIDPTSIVAVAPATTALGPVHITLTNASGTSAQTSASEFTYTRSDDATLSGLSISTGVLSPTFAPGTTAYSISNARDGMTVTPTVNTTGAVVDVKVGSGSFVSVTSGSSSLPLSLDVGSNTITVRVTADDGTTTRNYTITATRLSSVATLSAASIKGVTASLGTAGATIGSETAGSVTLTTAQATGSAVSSFTKTDSGATVTKIVKFSSGTIVDSTSFSAAGAFTSGATTPMVDGDFFVVQVTAADGTVNFTRINVVVNSNIATLSAASVKGLTATLGVPSETISSATAGSVTLTTAQGIGSALTSFTTTHGGATITKIVKYSSGSTVSVLTFASAMAFTNGSTTPMVDGDFFVVQVTAADGTVNFTRINVVVNSNIATLSAASIKGVTASLGTAGATIGSETAGSVTLTTAQGIGSASTSFTRAHGGATITKIAKFPSGAIVDSTSFSAAEAFTSGATTPMVDGDFFVVQVTAADGTVNFTRINVVMNSNIATLSAASVKGLTATLGVPSETIGSATAGSVTLTTAQGIGSAVTSFTTTHGGATITKTVKFSFGSTASLLAFSSELAFSNGAATQVADGDFFIVQVTAADGTVNYTRINVVVNSNIATLSAASIKGVTASLGTAGATIGSETAGSVTLTTAQSTSSAVTSFVKTHVGATVSKIVKFPSGAIVDSASFLAAEAFTSGATTPMVDGDFFVVHVTAADGTVNFTRINVDVNSNIATLSAASIKGVTASLGTAGATIGSETAGSVTLTTAQGIGSAVTSFTTTHGGATITKTVKFSSGSTTSASAFTSATAFSNGSTTPMVDGDFFVVQVTAADGTVNFTRINVVVNSNIATLSAASIKGVTASLGTAGAMIGSETAGSATLTTAQATGSALSTFTRTDNGAVVTKIAKFSSGTVVDSTNFLAAEAFTSGAATQVTDGDFFVIQVTAADGTVNFTRINVDVNSNIATLGAASIKGVVASLGTANAAFGSETAGAATLTTAQGVGSAVTSFTTTHGGATITKIVKFSSGSTANVVTFASEAAFSSGATTPMVNGDFFVVQVTAADGTVNFTRINVVVNSNIATLSSASVKGLNATLGTASPTIGSATPGSVMLTAAQGSGTAVTSFTTTHGGATITKIVKFSSGSTANTANFLAAQAFTNGATTQVADGDFFVIEVTAADGTVIYTRINVVFSANPSVPRNFSASGRQGGADLTWSAPVTDGGSAITGYFVQRSTDSTNWTDVGTTNAGTTSYSVTGLSNGTSFVYRVRAVNDSGSLIYNFATSGATVTDYLVSCSGGGSFYVRGSVIPSAAGKDCSGTATIPQGIVEVAINSFAPGSAATQTNRALTALVFPPGFKHIGQGGFRNLGLTSLTIPASVTMVGLAAFENNPLTSVTITGASGAESTFLSQGSFTNQGVQFNLNTSIALTFGSGKIEIGHNFGRSTTFSTVDFGSGLTSIAESAFKQNGIAPGWVPVFPSTIKTIEQNAFTYNPNMKTIRFGSSTTSSITSISDIAFDTTLEDVQYCGPSGTVLSNYLARRLSSALIWCSTEVPNAPIDLTAAPSNGQVALTWTRGALRDEAPTSDYLIQYSSNSGQTWTTFTRSASKLTSATVTGLSNGTNYTFRVAAVNLFGNSTYSSTATAKPLGQSFTPIFGPSTATSNGFTVNVTNFDSSFVYDSGTVTSGSGSVFIGSPAGGLLPITVTGMSAGATSTISIRSSKEGVSDGIGYASGSALQAALIPTVDNIVRATGGFTARIANYDANFTWNASATPGNVLVSPTGGISVTGVSPSTQVVLELSTSRTGFVAGTSSTTVTTLQLLQVLYDGNGATGGSAPTDSQQYGSSEVVTVMGNPSQGGLSRSGSVFVGWTINPNGTGVVYQSGTTLQLASTTVTLYAKWSLIPYSVTYKPNGATGGSVPIDLSSYTIGQSAPVFGNTGNLVRPGYSFIGWGYNSTATDVLYQSGDSYTVGTSNISFWARWTADTYTVTYDSNGATGSPSKASDSYTTASTPISLATAGSLTKVGHNFVGWGVSAVSAPVSDSYTVTEDTRLYAQWRASNYSVTYLAGVNGTGTPPTQANVNFASSFSVASPSGLTSNDGQNEYAFVSWSDGTKTYSPGQNYLMGAQPVVLTAQWTRIYNVRYSFNGGSVATPIADQQKISGDVVTITAVIPVRAGYEFLNWRDQSGRVASAGDSYSVSDDHYLLYAQWRAISYSVSYDVNGGDTEPQEPNHVIGDTFNVAAGPTKAGYDFSHWSDGTNQYNAGTTYLVGASHVNLQAIWTPQVYRISFDFNGGVGSPIAPIDYTFNTPAATLPMTGISRPDFSFRGWSTSASATNGSSTFTPSGDVLLRAVWVSSVYRLTFDAVNGYADRASDKVTIGQSTTLPSATRANHTLLGWSTQQSGGTTLSAGDTYVPTADATLYARWALQVFTITYDGNGGTATENSASMTFGSTTPIVLPNAGRLNYVFNGWYSAARGGYLLGVAGASFAPTTSLTAYAQWIQGSLAGMGPATQIAQATVQAGYDLSFTAGSNGSTATVSYKADSLPDGTVITAFVENSTTRVTPLLATRAEPILTLILSWVAPDGSVPNTATGKPIVMTITNSNITAGSKVFGLIGDVPVYLGTSVEDGQVQVSISEDPAVIVAMVTPDAPTAVIAAGVDETSARISWTAPGSNGGSPITRFTATSSSGQSCNSVTTSCVITGLTAGASYSFTVKATNAIGDGSLSVASQTLRLTAAVAQPTTTVPTSTVPTSTVPTVGAVPAGSDNVPGKVPTGNDVKSGQEKEALEIAGEVLKSVQESATENAQNALESLTDQDEPGAKPKSPDDKEVKESASEGSGDSSNNAFWFLLLLVLLLVGSFMAIRTFVKRK
jgi:hypothetical protein